MFVSQPSSSLILKSDHLELELSSGLGRYRDNVLKKFLVYRNNVTRIKLFVAINHIDLRQELADGCGCVEGYRTKLQKEFGGKRGSVYNLFHRVCPLPFLLITDAARGASATVLTEPGLSVIITVVLTCRATFQRMKKYTIYAASITICIVFGFMFIALTRKFDFYMFMVLIIAILNNGALKLQR
ncbi:hypothetical protein L1987_70855 [Smallanthus sonchifolius]|uniref:Uncharacterized protein n=1 Tax=Smallanthus sonchifolius TaxID=185202 RepID=A0ACB9APZ9_9ASTR|nr:hypothetical protein L1987_70855 [Smallanthus sonchifolius]